MAGAETVRRRNLPHWDVPYAAYFVTTCLEGSIPAHGLLDIQGYRKRLQCQARPNSKSVADWQREQWKRAFSRTDSWLDHRPAVCHLSDPRLAQVVADALYHFAGQRYDLLDFVVMPSHLHWVFQPLEAWLATFECQDSSRTPRERILHSINRYTALQCNKLLRTTGPFWQHESYDHWVRDTEEMERILLYIEANPVRAGLVHSPEQWLFSSARHRMARRIELGVPLLR